MFKNLSETCWCYYKYCILGQNWKQVWEFRRIVPTHNWLQKNIRKFPEAFKLGPTIGNGEEKRKDISGKHYPTGKICITCTVVKAGGIFLFPRIFPSYFMKILKQIFRKNFLRSISLNFSKSNSNFSELPHSMIYDERFRDLSGRLSADIVLSFFCQILRCLHSTVAMRLTS